MPAWIDSDMFDMSISVCWSPISSGWSCKDLGLVGSLPLLTVVELVYDYVQQLHQLQLQTGK